MRLELVKNYSTFSLASMALGSQNQDRRESVGSLGEGMNSSNAGGGHNRKQSVGSLSVAFSISGESQEGKRRSCQIEDGPDDVKKSFVARVRHNMAQCCSLKTVEKSLPIVRWTRAYTLEKLMADCVAAITVTITMLPQALAYAVIADLRPEVGLWSCFVGCLVHFFFGGSPHVIVGPTAILAILTNTYTEQLDRSCYIMLTFLTGILAFSLGVFKLGFIVNFISKPVSSAFTSAAALTICSTQVKEALGLKFRAQGFIDIIIETVDHIVETKMPDFLLSFACVGVLVFLRHLPDFFGLCGIKDNPIIKFISIARNSLVVIVTASVVYTLSTMDEQPFTVVDEIKAGLPPFSPPPFSMFIPSKNETYKFVADILERQTSAILFLPLLALMEHISIAKALAGDQILDANQEMVSTGLSNIIGSFFSSMPITGSFSLTTVNAASGARTPASGFIAGGLVLLAIEFLAPWFSYIPKSSLAAVIICAVIYMIDLSVIRTMWMAKRMEVLPWVLTTGISLVVGLEFGMMAGFLISVTYLLYYAARPGVKVKRGFTTAGTEFVLIMLDRSLTFPSVEYIRYILVKASRAGGKNKLALIIDCHHIQFVDFTAALGLTDLIQQFRKRNQCILLWNVKESVLRVLQEVGTESYICETEAELEDRIDAAASVQPHLNEHGIQIEVTDTNN